MRTNTDIILDTEFNSRRGKFTIDPISFALVSADGEDQYYAVSSEFSRAAARRHEFLVAHVLPKLPPPEQREPISAIRAGIAGFFQKVTGRHRANQMTLWAKNGGMGDFVLMDLLFDGRFFETMNALGIERSYMKDTATLREQAGSPKLDIPIDPAQHHTAIGDVLRERQFFLAYQQMIAAKPA